MLRYISAAVAAIAGCAALARNAFTATIYVAPVPLTDPYPD